MLRQPRRAIISSEYTHISFIDAGFTYGRLRHAIEHADCHIILQALHHYLYRVVIFAYRLIWSPQPAQISFPRIGQGR